MLIIPAIDIQGGQVVRLTQGNFKARKVYSEDPVKTARHWAKQGASLMHVVDLDGAAAGEPRNLNILKNIIQAVGVPVEFGGGVRKIETIKRLLNLGATRVVLGTRAVEDPGFLKQASRLFKDKVIVSVDTKGLDILVKGWQKKARAGAKVTDFLKVLRQAGFQEFIYTDVRKDGMLEGPNLRDTKRILKESKMRLIVSGGISSLVDIRKLKALEKDGLIGVIVGKALYEGKFTLPQALKIA